MPMIDLGKALSRNNIVPSDIKEYSLKDIQQAILKTWGVNPQIECRTEKGVDFLFEIRMCFSKDLILIDCYANHVDILTNCNKNKGVIYPKSIAVQNTPNKLYVQLYKFVSWLKWMTL